MNGNGMNRDNGPGITTTNQQQQPNNVQQQCVALLKSLVENKSEKVNLDDIPKIARLFNANMKGRESVCRIGKLPAVRNILHVFGGLYGDIEALYKLFDKKVIDLDRLQESEFGAPQDGRVSYVFLGNYSEYGIFGATVMCVRTLDLL